MSRCTATPRWARWSTASPRGCWPATGNPRASNESAAQVVLAGRDHYFKVAPLELLKRLQALEAGIRRNREVPVAAVVGHEHPVLLQSQGDGMGMLREAVDVDRRLQ